MFAAILAMIQSLFTRTYGVKEVHDDLEDSMQKATGPVYDQDTDSQEALRENQDAIKGAGWSASTDTLEEIRDAVDAVGLQFTQYTYSGSINADTGYTPPAKTIVMAAKLAGTTDVLEVRVGGEVVATPKTGEYGVIGAIYCDGSNVTFHNIHVAARTLELYGLTMA